MAEVQEKKRLFQWRVSDKSICRGVGNNQYKCSCTCEKWAVATWDHWQGDVVDECTLEGLHGWCPGDDVSGNEYCQTNWSLDHAISCIDCQSLPMINGDNPGPDNDGDGFPDSWHGFDWNPECAGMMASVSKESDTRAKGLRKARKRKTRRR